MNKGHENAQDYRADFAGIVIDEMVRELGANAGTAGSGKTDNESTLKEVFG